MHYIGVDLGGTSIKAGIVDDSARILVDGKIPTRKEEGHERVLEDMAALCRDLMDQAGLQEKDIHSIGVGSPGPSDDKNGILIFATNLDFHNVPIRKKLQEHFNLPVHLENDANCAALAESVSGASRECKDSVLLTLGTGVGGGIVLNRKIYSGFNGAGSELGHMVIVNQGTLCTCGRLGCFEQYASATGLVRQTIEAIQQYPESLMNDLAGGDMSRVSAKTAFIAQRQRDATADRVVRQYIDYLSDGIVNIINILYPEMIVIGGGVSREGENLMRPLREAVLDKAFCHEVDNPRVVKALMGNEAGMVGAAMLGKINAGG
ncbi:MAG: ROK family protein [Clostridia bacterium]